MKSRCLTLLSNAVGEFCLTINFRALCIYSLQFNESWHLLVDWMTEVEQTLDTHKEIAVTQEEIKQQLSDLKVHQIGYSVVLRLGGYVGKWYADSIQQVHRPFEITFTNNFWTSTS